MTYTDAEIEAAARAIALADSIEYIKATSDASELGHASDSGWADWMPHARSALSAGPREPEGWRLVPVEPTEEMIAAVENYSEWASRGPEDVYPAMLAAAPRYGEGKP